MLLQRFALLLVPVIAVTGLLAGNPAASAATTCSRTTCTGKDPETAGCSTGAKTIDSMTLGDAYLELRYSTRCVAGWVRYTGNSTDEQFPKGTIEGGYVERGTFHEQVSETGPETGSTTAWTKMISGSYTLKLCGKVYFSSVGVLIPSTCRPAFDSTPS